LTRINCPRCRELVPSNGGPGDDWHSCPSCGERWRVPVLEAAEPALHLPPLRVREIPVESELPEARPAPPPAPESPWENLDAPAAPSVLRSRGKERDLSEAKVFNHIIKIAVCAFFMLVPLVCGGGLVLTASLRQPLLSPCMIFPLMLSYLFVAAIARNVHAFFFGPVFRLTPAGIRLRYWRPAGAVNGGFLLPFYRAVAARVPWEEFRRCHTYTHTTNGSVDWATLTIETERGPHVIAFDIFTAKVQDMQEAILDYRENEFRQPLRERLNVARFCGRWFRRPLRLRFESREGWLSRMLAGLFGDKSEGKRFVELCDEGLAMGDHPDDLRVVRWERVKFARLSSLTRNGHTVQTLQVHLHDGRMLEFLDGYEVSLEELSEFLDPPLEKVSRAYELMDLGDDVETAAERAGLPPVGHSRR
jgi:hypothetical protein